jgi:hypothetical protein
MALVRNQEAWGNCAQEWIHLHQGLSSGFARMAPGGMGLIGRMAGFPEDYNNAVQEITGKVKSGIDQLGQNSDNMGRIAQVYIAKDREYYERFGYIEDET